jgi:hypothetical protein
VTSTQTLPGASAMTTSGLLISSTSSYRPQAEAKNYSVWVASLTSDRPTGEEDEQGTAYIPALAFASPAGQQSGRYEHTVANLSWRGCGSADARRQARVNRMSIQGCQVSPSSVRSQKAVIV